MKAIRVFHVDYDGRVDGDRIGTSVDRRDGQKMNAGLLMIERRRRLDVYLAGVRLDAEQVPVTLLGQRRERVDDGAVEVYVAVASPHASNDGSRRRVLQYTHLRYQQRYRLIAVRKFIR